MHGSQCAKMQREDEHMCAQNGQQLGAKEMDAEKPRIGEACGSGRRWAWGEGGPASGSEAGYYRL